MAHAPLAIANRLLKKAQDRGVPVTIMKLIKLVYIAHGWTLAILNKPLTDQAPEAWQHGPVYRDVYNAFRGSGWSVLTDTAKDSRTGTEHLAALTPEEESVVDEVLDAYGKFHAFELSARTHKVGTPWFDTYRGGEGKYEEIPNALIKSHFDKLNGANA